MMLISATIEGIKILSLEENKRTSFNYVSWVQNFNTLQSSHLNNRVKLQFFSDHKDWQEESLGMKGNNGGESIQVPALKIMNIGK